MGASDGGANYAKKYGLKTITLYLPATAADALARAAANADSSKGQFVRKIVTEYLKESGLIEKPKSKGWKKNE